MPTTSNSNSTYTYRNGQKVLLFKKDDEFVARAEPEALESTGATFLEKVSPSATRMHVAPADLEASMAKSRAIATTHHAYYHEDTDQPFDITDRILVTFKTKPQDAALDAFMAKYALRQLAKYSDRDFLLQLTNDTGMNPVKLVCMITETEPAIDIVEHDLNVNVKKYALTLPNDPKYISQWHLHKHTTPSADYDPRSSSRCEEAWLLLNSFGKKDVVIGLSDDGCKLDHADFDSTDKFAAWGYFQGSRLVTVNDVDANPSMMHETGANHGTSCAGVIAGEADGVLTVGAAPDCRLLPIKWQSNGPSLEISDSKFLTALNYISDKVDIFSNSWGSSPRFNFSSQVIDRIQALTLTGGRRGKGIVFLWASGNENCPIEHTGAIDIPFDDGIRVIAGAAQWVGVHTSRIFAHNLTSIPGVMHIAALASNAQRSHYSNYGSSISLCAPTNNVHQYSRMTVKGLGVVTTDGDSPLFTNEFGGTSSATPLVAGIAGLVISANPNLTAQEVINVLEQTASKNLNFTPYPKTPPASFDPDTSWDVSPVPPHNTGAFINLNSVNGSWSPWFGFGKVDALKAVERAMSLSSGQASVVIHSALINPVGPDTQKETVKLKNMGASPVLLDGWALANQSNKKQVLSGSIAANAQLSIPLNSSKIILTNKGGTIKLLDDNNIVVDSVTYIRKQAPVGVETIF